MQIRRIVVSPECIEGDRARLRGDLHHHLCHVLRLGPGAEVVLVDGSGTLYEGKISSVGDHEVTVAISRQAPAPREQRPRMALIYGLSRRTRTELVLQKTTELGVDRIVPCLCQRSISRPRQPALKLERWQEILAQASRQSGRATVPLLSPILPFDIALADADPAEVRLIAHPGGAPLQHFRDPLRSARDTIVLAVGPEGGWSEQEVQTAITRGFDPVSLGPTILRTETAAITLLALIAFICGRLGSDS